MNSNKIIENYFLFLYLFFSSIYLFFELKNFNLPLQNIVLYLITFILITLFIIFLLKKIIFQIVNNINNIFNKKYLFYIADTNTKDSNNFHNIKNIKEFLIKKQKLFIEIAKENKDDIINDTIIIFYPYTLDGKEERKVIEIFKEYFAFFSVYYFRKYNNLKKLLQNVLILNLFILMILFIKIMISKYFEHLNISQHKALALVETILLFIIVLSYFQFLIIWNEKYNPSNIKNLYLNLKKDLNVNVDIFTIYIFNFNNQEERKYSFKELIETISNEINEKYAKTLELTLQLLLAISFISSITIFSVL